MLPLVALRLRVEVVVPRALLEQHAHRLVLHARLRDLRLERGDPLGRAPALDEPPYDHQDEQRRVDEGDVRDLEAD